MNLCWTWRRSFASKPDLDVGYCDAARLRAQGAFWFSARISRFGTVVTFPIGSARWSNRQPNTSPARRTKSRPSFVQPSALTPLRTLKSTGEKYSHVCRVWCRRANSMMRGSCCRGVDVSFHNTKESFGERRLRTTVRVPPLDHPKQHRLEVMCCLSHLRNQSCDRHPTALYQFQGASSWASLTPAIEPVTASRSLFLFFFNPVKGVTGVAFWGW
jgi:hypothetical protein